MSAYPALPHARVLVVDDTETNLYMAEAMLEPFGIVPDLAQSGAEALERVQQGHVYDIIFMDHMMPDMDGIETTQALRQAGCAFPIVALTAHANHEQEKEFLAKGFDGFMTKPLCEDALQDMLLRYIN